MKTEEAVRETLDRVTAMQRRMQDDNTGYAADPDYKYLDDVYGTLCWVLDEGDDPLTDMEA